MKTLSYVLLFFAGVLFYSCATHKLVNSNIEDTPGVVAINKSLMCDQTEVTNFGWAEYMFWTQQIFGENSEEYLSTIVDLTVWEEYGCLKLGKDNIYVKHPAYKSFPIVGISQEQAMDYTKWRSNRVFEYFLIKNKVLHFNPDQSSANYFSIENYFTGKYQDLVPTGDTTTLVTVIPDLNQFYPEYRLPDSTERLLILDYIDSTDFRFHQKKTRQYLKWREYNLPFQLAITPCDSTQFLTEPMRQVRHYIDIRNRFGLIHESRGNAAEWGVEPDLTYGGGWPHNVSYTLSKDTVSASSPNAWTGFRNVCEWKKWNPID